MASTSRRHTVSAVLFVAFFLFQQSCIAKEEKSCADCHPEFVKKLTRKHDHRPFGKRKCMACHQFHGFRNRLEFKEPVIDLCTQCHETARDLPEDDLHAPMLDEEACIQCHSPHSSDNKKLLLKPGTQICFDCHDEANSDANGVHPPYAEAKCLECHDPHGSSFGHSLQMPAAYLCLACHPDILENYAPEEMHAAKDIKSCEQCHDGHQSDHPRLLKDEVTPLCLSCHTKIKDLMGAAPVHPVLEENDCLACHTPHYRKGTSSLAEAVPDLCLNCHDEIKAEMARTVIHPPAEEGDCTACHNPHAGIRPVNQPELCEGCHDLDDQGFLKKHAGLHPSTCTGCHSPHGSNDASLLKANQHVPFAEGDCDACHTSDSPSTSLHSNQLCLTCHDQPEADGPHSHDKTRSKHCIDCHNPHTSDSD